MDVVQLQAPVGGTATIVYGPEFIGSQVAVAEKAAGKIDIAVGIMDRLDKEGSRRRRQSAKAGTSLRQAEGLLLTANAVQINPQMNAALTAALGHVQTGIGFADAHAVAKGIAATHSASYGYRSVPVVPNLRGAAQALRGTQALDPDGALLKMARAALS